MMSKMAARVNAWLLLFVSLTSRFVASVPFSHGADRREFETAENSALRLSLHHQIALKVRLLDRNADRNVPITMDPAMDKRTLSDNDIPTSWDWRNHGIATPTKQQGQMGSSDAIAVTDALESFIELRTGRLVSLSAQEVVDCCSELPASHKDGTNPIARYVFECIHKHRGLCSEGDYIHVPNKCSNSTCHGMDEATHTNFVKFGDENELELAVLKTPVAVGVDASRASFQLYKSGIYRDPDCSSSHVDHVMLLIGYGELDGRKYWICQNSWGEAWGNKGYIWMAKDEGNMCGIASYARYPS